MMRLESSWALVLPVLGLFVLWWRQQREEASARRTVYFELWEKASQGTKLWDRWQWTRSQWSRLFLWLACFAGALAAAKPAWVGPGGAHFRIVLDRSASMKANTKAGISRAQETVTQLVAFLHQRKPGDRVSLWSLGRSLEPLVSETDDFASIEAALDRFAPEAESANLSLLVAKIPAHVGSQTILFSDARIEGARSEGDWTLWGVGDAVANAGILSLRVEGVWPRKAIRLRGEVQNFSSQPQTRTLLLISTSDRKQQEISLAPQEKRSFVFESERGTGGEIRVRLEPADEFPADDEAAVTLAAAPQSSIVLLGATAASDEISPLAAAAAAWSEQAEIPLQKLADPASAPAGAVLLADGGRLETLPTRMRGAILFGCQIPGLLGEPLLQRPKLLDWKREHPILRGLGFDFLACTQAYSVLGEAQPLVMSAEGPLLVGLEKGDSRVVAAAFRLADSNLPVQANFPVLLGRAYAWILGNPQDEEPRLVWANARVPFLDPAECSLEQIPPRGPNRPIPEGPGHAQEFLGPCLWAGALFLALALFLRRPLR